MLEKVRNLVQDESGQTTIEWIVLSIMIALGLVVIGLAIQNGVVSIIDALVEKIIGIIGSISI